ncbi:hypothetical protein CEXT_65351 [Caerostris extrusa]|uniref:Uncharacterized protein n=1 Tax=Caerostris extrusa TaxID=172846 RepID=A0AAV4V4Q4_CAEEX|nr:hypothetical protein CEXT_65351 [Caerostris extrusa]
MYLKVTDEPFKDLVMMSSIFVRLTMDEGLPSQPTDVVSLQFGTNVFIGLVKQIPFKETAPSCALNNSFVSACFMKPGTINSLMTKRLATNRPVPAAPTGKEIWPFLMLLGSDFVRIFPFLADSEDSAFT